MAVSTSFYKKIFGFEVISSFGERGCALAAGDKRVLLLFKRGGSVSHPTPHDGAGELHVAFAIATADLAAWQSWLAANSIPIEETRTWDRGGVSLYFRDPDRNLLEVATPGVWSIY